MNAPHFALPFSWAATGHAAEVEQDSQEDVANCLAALVLCPLGWRPELVEYGTPEQTFLLDLQDEELASAITRWEPRAQFELQESEVVELVDRLLRVLMEVPQ